MNAEEPQKPSLAQRALAAHSAVALLASALLYIIALSGALVVVAPHLQRWEQPSAPEHDAIEPAAVEAAIAAALARDAGKSPTTHIYVRLPDEYLPRTAVTTDHASW